jgi:hypothetical protein
MADRLLWFGLRYFCCATRCPQGLPVQLPDLGAPCCCPPYRLRQLVEQGAGQDQLLKEAAQPTVSPAAVQQSHRELQPAPHTAGFVQAGMCNCAPIAQYNRQPWGGRAAV